jgi:glycosyltransferase involved in cell wall biosynthesis
MKAPTVGLAVIARDEESTLPHLLKSIEGAFDQVALLDTGSTDRTIQVFEEWSAGEKGRQPEFISTLGHFEWCDDFATARNASYELLDTDWFCYADADDQILDAELLRDMVLRPEAQESVAIAFPYFWRLDIPPGDRVRLTRMGDARWQGALHEQLVFGACEGGLNIMNVRDFPAWRHRPHRPTSADLERQADRNAEILRKWQEREPDNDLPTKLIRGERNLRARTIKGTDIPLGLIEAHITEQHGPEIRCCLVCPHGVAGVRGGLTLDQVSAEPWDLTENHGERQSRQVRRAEARKRAKEMASR